MWNLKNFWCRLGGGFLPLIFTVLVVALAGCGEFEWKSQGELGAPWHLGPTPLRYEGEVAAQESSYYLFSTTLGDHSYVFTEKSGRFDFFIYNDSKFLDLAITSDFFDPTSPIVQDAPPFGVHTCGQPECTWGIRITPLLDGGSRFIIEFN